MATDNTSATFEIRLEDGTSGPAESAASALKSLRSQIDADTKALSEMQKAMKNLQGGTSVNVAQFRELKKRIDEKKTAIAQAQSSYLSLGGTFSRTASSGRSMKSMLERLTEAAKATPGPIGGLTSQLGSLRALVAGGVIVAGIVAITAAIAALVVGTGIAIAALTKYGIAQASARRDELLRFEGLTKIRSIYGWVAGKASDLQASLDQVSASSALGRDQLAKYTEQLYRMGLRGQNLTDALDGMAIKAATQGEAQASLFASMAAGAALAGGSVRKLADDVRSRLGELAARKMLSLDVQISKMREHFGVLFRNIKVEGFLKSLNTITALFSQSTASGRALKALVETLLQPLIDGFSFLAPIAKRFFQGMILGTQFLAIQVLKLALWFKKAFGGSDLLKGIDLTTAALYAGEAAVAVLAIGLAAAVPLVTGLGIALAAWLVPVLWGAATALASVAAGALLAAAPFVLWAAAIGLVVYAGYQLYKVWNQIEWADMGTAIVDGIVSGLKRGASWVLDAVKALGKNAWGAFRKALGIASPSKEFAKLGVEIPRGVQAGISAGAPGAQRAADSMVSVPDAPYGAGGGASRNVTIDVGGITVNSSAGDARGIAQDIRAELERILEGVAIQLGARVPGGA
jgi:hypothetical protein